MKHLVSCLTLAVVLMCAASSAVASGDVLNPILRICIADEKPSVRITLKGGYQIRSLDGNRTISEGRLLSATIRPGGSGILIGKQPLNEAGVRVSSLSQSGIYVNGKKFRGDIEIVKKSASSLMVINFIPLEEYLYGVLYHEVSHTWPLEALKAQAIAARTFAVYQVSQNKTQPFDLRSDIYSQVYGGSGSEKWSTNKAVDVTRGKILTYNGHVLPSYYHATCAGMTEDAANLWNVDISPLKGVPCDYCKDSPHYKWHAAIQLWKVENALKIKGYKLGKIEAVSIISRNKSGRVDKMGITDNAGVGIIITGKDFRYLLGPNLVRSTKFDLRMSWRMIVLDGTGWGHGVGMCQWGAHGMAKKGKSVDEILSFYYPGCEITSINKNVA